MRNVAGSALAASVVLALLGGCATPDAGAKQARGQSARTSAGSATPEPETPPPSGPPWPSYDVEDYTFTLRVRCFCPDAGVPVTVTVADGEVVDAVFAEKGWSRPAGAPAPEWHRVTINDVIETANDTNADTVVVRWPAGQDYPRSVWVDRDTNAIDEEVGYTIGNVDPA